MNRIFTSTCLCTALLCGPALADEEPWLFVNNGVYPNIGMDWDSAFQYDYNRLDADSSAGRTTTDGYLDINPVFHFRFSPNNEIWLDVEANPLNSPPDQGDSRWFGDMGVTINDLNFYRASYRSWLRVGKYEIPFGRAWDVAPGLYTTNFVDSYHLDGYLGAVYAYRINAGSLGVIEPIVGTHAVDTTFLGRSYFQSDSRTKKSAGGPANTGFPESFSTVVNWSAIPALPNLEAQAGYIYNKRGVGNDKSETAYVMSALYYIPLAGSNQLGPSLDGKYFDIVPFIEYAKFENMGGKAGTNLSYLTTSITVDYGNWNIGLTRTNTSMSGANSDDSTPDDYINEFSIQYNFSYLFSIQVGMGTMRSMGDKSDFVGINFDYSRPF